MSVGMSAKQGWDQHQLLHASWPDNCCLCIHEKEIKRLQNDQEDWRKGVALIASAVDITDTLSCVAISERVLEQGAEVERLQADIEKYKDQLEHYSNLNVPPIPDLKFSVLLPEEETA